MPSILDDRLIAVRLAAYPEFRVRLLEFLLFYSITERPALVVQARPARGCALPDIRLEDADIQKRFLAGVSSKDGWWQGFGSMVAVRHTFHGISSLPSREEPSWASEIHHDGHFIAGIWKFPELSLRDKSVEVVADFHMDMFVDFGRLVESTLERIREQPTYETTWTLAHAPKLHYGSKSMWGQYSVTSPPLKIPNLQWGVWAAKVGTPEWKQLATQMGQALTGAYGDAPRPAQ